MTGQERHEALTKRRCPVTKLNINPGEFESYCFSHGLRIHGPEKKKFKPLLPLALGALGALAGPAAIVAGVVSGSLFQSISEPPFSKDNLVSQFNRAKETYVQWGKLFQELELMKQRQNREIERQRIAYRQMAERNWQRFYQLRLLDGLDKLTGTESEAAIAGLYESKGFEVQITKATGDFGVDILASKEGKTLAIQAKRWGGKVGVKAIQEVASGAYFYKADTSAVVTSSFFTDKAKELAKSLGVQLIDKEILATMWESYSCDIRMPPFDIEKYERQAAQIEKELGRISAASGTSE
jgi:HJR/Mrr/RecB family endonuclease